MIKNLSVIIPARNENHNLKKLVPALFERYHKNIFEIIIVNDNSTDDTPLTIQKLKNHFKKIKLINRQSSCGVGLALREGIKNLSPFSKYVLFMDCDFIINVPDIQKLIDAISSYDGVAGSRFLKKDSLKNYPFLKKIANRSYHFLAKIFLGINHSDLTNNFKLYRKELVDKIYPLLLSSDFAINSELGFYPPLLGATIGQIPVTWRERTRHMGFSKFKILKVGPSYLYIFLRLLLMKWGLITYYK